MRASSRCMLSRAFADVDTELKAKMAVSLTDSEAGLQVAKLLFIQKLHTVAARELTRVGAPQEGVARRLEPGSSERLCGHGLGTGIGGLMEARFVHLFGAMSQLHRELKLVLDQRISR